MSDRRDAWCSPVRTYIYMIFLFLWKLTIINSEARYEYDFDCSFLVWQLFFSNEMTNHIYGNGHCTLGANFQWIVYLDFDKKTCRLGQTNELKECIHYKVSRRSHFSPTYLEWDSKLLVPNGWDEMFWLSKRCW